MLLDPNTYVRIRAVLFDTDFDNSRRRAITIVLGGNKPWLTWNLPKLESLVEPVHFRCDNVLNTVAHPPPSHRKMNSMLSESAVRAPTKSWRTDSSRTS